ncbi:hypothetical protein K432DRAFT_349202 [Lepidopterella palustris CBS 459.81]|uniref:NACHT domain-containing protein n=1 Tax=Lepidopterella palustris CBS 459.81 TaxID=1314670 RepID=A0A8E2EEJ2_9PEZI|nr:hypothetical protein K432DRAFT_349202 [Lepidopterella palustris CBS 459.81]
MVLDPFTALGLAGNVLQIIDFGSKLFSEGSELYKSSIGASSSNVQLEKDTKTLRQLSDKISSALGSTSIPIQELSDDEIALRGTATSCQRTADELLSILLDLRVKGPNRKRQSLLQAFRGVRKKEQIEQLCDRLSEYRGQLTLHLVHILNEYQGAIGAKVDFLIDENQRMQVCRTTQLEYISKDLKQLHRNTEDLKAIFEKRTLDLVSRGLSAVLQTSENLAAEQRILRSLRFDSMGARHSTIAEAHRKTFNWVFCQHEASSEDPEPQLKFKDWLENGSGFYWISGKAGSGKSTLMKYLYDDPRTRNALWLWAGEQNLVLASFFFWSSGTEMQRSQKGLLQSLLFEILRSCPAFIRTICSSRWPKAQSAAGDFVPEPWTLSELSQMFQKVMNEKTPKFCFFIDGLDEYEGDHSEMIQVLKGFLAWPDIKICLSSRPWNIFEDAFGQNIDRKLYLQDLTREDIKLYAQSKFEESDIFQRLKKKDPRYQDLVFEITDKAQGVFLWVFLVVRSLLEGLVNADRIPDLQRRLRQIPGDLERFFQYMLDSVDEIYQEQTVQIFQVSVLVREPLPLLTFWFLDEEDPDFALTMKTRPLDEEEILLRFEEARRRLDGRCKGLLEITKDASVFHFRVDFLHRTVKDWFKTAEMQDLIAKRLDGEFNPHVLVSKAFLAHVKCLPSPVPKRTLLQMVNDIMYHAKQAEESSGVRNAELLKELYRVAQALLPGRPKGDSHQDNRTVLDRQNHDSLDQLRELIGKNEKVVAAQSGFWRWLSWS